MPVPGLPGVRLHLADDVMALCQLTGQELGRVDPDLPYWGFAWPGGMAVSRYLEDHPEVVRDRRVLDLASGSGLCAIVAMQSGAESARAFDIDPFAGAAIELNAHANKVRVRCTTRDVLDEPPPPCDVILAGDVFYQESMAARAITWLRAGARGGARVLIGDPGRTYLPAGLERLATYRVPASREVENAEVKEAAVYTVSSESS